MSLERFLLLLAVWLVAGLASALVLCWRGHSNWRWIVACVLTGPLSIAFVIGQLYLNDRPER